MSANPARAVERIESSLPPRQARWLLIGGLFFIAYATALVWMTYQAQTQRQEAGFAGTRLEAEKLAAAIAYFIDERRNDLADQAASAEVVSYFSNQALGMSLEYGLRANLLSILGRMHRLLEGKHLNGEPIYRRMALIAHDGTLLVATDRNIQERAALLTPVIPANAQAAIASVPDTDEIVISAPVLQHGHLHGQIVAWVSAGQLQRHFLSLRGESIMTFLLPPDGRWQNPGGTAYLPPDRMLSLTGLRPGQWLEWPAGTLAPEHPPVRVTAVTVGDTPFRLIALIPQDDPRRPGVSRNLLIAAAAVPLLLVIALIVLARLYQANRKLLHQARTATRKHLELNVRNSDLEQEIRRREETEKRLREQQQLLEDKTGALERAMAEAQHLAQYDTLTKLSNRMFFREGLRRAMGRASRDGSLLAVLFIDLDHFKRINDTLGHPAGDQLLLEAANRLEHAVRETDIVGLTRPDTDYRLARQGGDEFTILLAELHDPLVAGSVAKRILEQMSRPIVIGANEVVVTASIGISVFPTDGNEVDTLLKNADVAMYSAKANGRNQYSFFEPAMQANALRRLALESDMRQGLARRQFTLHYQPQVDAVTGELQSFEALMRWHHPERGLIPPAEFIPVAEETGLILPLTRLALHQACQDIPAWKSRFGREIRVAINISGRVIELADIAELIGNALSQHGIGPHLIEAELTESVLMEGGERTRLLLERLRILGIRISIDDFGTGYSSLAYLKALPIDVLKIDKSFVNDVCSDNSSATIARTIIAMAHSLGLSVVAEGVETPAQRDFLRAERCETLQGYLFSRPLPPEQVIDLLAARGAAQ